MDAATINRPCYSEWEKLYFYHIATYGLNAMVCYSLKIKTNARGVSIRTYYRLFTHYVTSLLWSSQLLWLEIRCKWHSSRAKLIHGLATVCVPDNNSCISWAATLKGKCRWVGPPQCTQWGLRGYCWQQSLALLLWTVHWDQLLWEPVSRFPFEPWTPDASSSGWFFSQKVHYTPSPSFPSHVSVPIVAQSLHPLSHFNSHIHGPRSPCAVAHWQRVGNVPISDGKASLMKVCTDRVSSTCHSA